MKHPARNAIVFFFLGLLTTFLFLQIPETKSLFERLENDGYISVLLSGILYAFSFTAASASIIFVNMTEAINPPLAALVAGIGSVTYDMLIFLISRRTGQNRIQLFLHDHAPFKKRLPAWITLAIGGVILASPLPDEIAAGFFGISRLSTGHFLLLSYLLNTLGIFLLLSM